MIDRSTAVRGKLTIASKIIYRPRLLKICLTDSVKVAGHALISDMRPFHLSPGLIWQFENIQDIKVHSLCVKLLDALNYLFQNGDGQHWKFVGRTLKNWV